MTTSHLPSSIVTLRPATAADAPVVARLADLDSAPAPTGDLLLAVVDDRVVAVLSLDTGAVVADPFSLTGDYVRLLRERATSLEVAASRGGRSGGRGRAARARVAAVVPWARFG